MTDKPKDSVILKLLEFAKSLVTRRWFKPAVGLGVAGAGTLLVWTLIKSYSNKLTDEQKMRLNNLLADAKREGANKQLVDVAEEAANIVYPLDVKTVATTLARRIKKSDPNGAEILLALAALARKPERKKKGRKGTVR